MLTTIQTFLEGKKTYLSAVGGAAVLVAVYFGYVDAEIGNQVLVLLGFAGLAALRASK